MQNVAETHPDVIQDEGQSPFVRLVELGDSALGLKVYTWVHHLDDQWRVGAEIRESILERFNAAGIEIPFPQHVVHMEKE